MVPTGRARAGTRSPENLSHPVLRRTYSARMDTTSYVCLPCRAAYKKPFPSPYDQDRDRVCPRCAGPMIHVGSAFATPRKRDTAAWRALSVLLHAGVRFHRGCSGGPGYRPRTLREVRERMAYARATGEPFARALVRRELP
ncbi:hypothetical protein GCM10010499_17440 [Streptomyces thermoviolaceus subsp. apingens]|nr:hypothetical protein GCM10010499_17440 [Streptomyces thermoviolaceus subsp. apingens]